MKNMSFDFDVKGIYDGKLNTVFMNYTVNGYPSQNGVRFEVEKKDYRDDANIAVLKIRIPSTEYSDGEDIQYVGKPETGIVTPLPLRYDTFSGETTFLFWGGSFYEPQYETIRPQDIGLEDGVEEHWSIEKLIGFEKRDMTPFVFGLILEIIPDVPPGIQLEEIVSRFLQR